MCTLIKKELCSKKLKRPLIFISQAIKKVVDTKFYNLGKIYSFSMDRNLIDKQIYEIITWFAY